MKHTVLAILKAVSVTLICGILLSNVITALLEKWEIQEIVEYLAEDTEDPGNYVIAVYPAESRFAEHPDAKFYFAEMIDNDGDYERLVVIVKDGEIYDVGIYE